MGFNFGFFGTQEQRVFNYKPRYYDPEKEALKEKFGHVDGRKEKEPYVKEGKQDAGYNRLCRSGTFLCRASLCSTVLFFAVGRWT